MSTGSDTASMEAFELTSVCLRRLRLSDLPAVKEAHASLFAFDAPSDEALVEALTSVRSAYCIHSTWAG